MEASKTHQIAKLVALVVIFALNFTADRAYSQGNSTTRTAEFTRGLYFDVLNDSNQPPPVLEYELSREGSQFKLGPIILDEKNFSFGIRRLNDLDPNGQAGSAEHFFIRWPTGLFREVRVELLNRDGQVMWNQAVTSDEIEKWRQKMAKLSSKGRSPLNSLTWGMEYNSANLPLEGLPDGFRFCLSRLQETSQGRLCSQSYVLRKTGNQSLLGRVRDLKPARILVNGEIAALQGEVKSEGGLPIRFFVEMSTGETLEFSSKPLKVKWVDYVKVEGRNIFRAIGHDTPPVTAFRILNPDKYPKWVEAVGFQSTIHDTRKFWVTQFQSDKPWLYFEGETGGLFKHPMPTEKVPSTRIRLHLDTRTPYGTYRDGVWFQGRKQDSSLLSSQEHKVKTSSGSQEFEWSFQARESAKINRSYILVNDAGESYKAYYEVYKGFSNELSARTSIILSSSGLILMGEAAYSHWFEDILRWDQYYLTKQRWGISTKYFQSITKYKVKGTGDASLRVLNADLKYRFTPGLWTRDETQGFMASYQDVNVDLGITDFKVPMLGMGWFWARSMPKFFDDIFNVVPFMRYPKWVDMEFIYYTGSTDSTKKLNFNFALNFHGQVLWKDNFFGEAGFGIKRYAIIDRTNSYQSDLGYALNTVYGTLGIGFKF